MISSISWVPKGVSKPARSVVEPPTEEEIEDLIKSGLLPKSGDVDGDSEDSEDDGEEMDVEATNEDGEVSQAMEVAKALGRVSKVTGSSSKCDDMTKGFGELHMDRYDDEDDGIDIFGGFANNNYYTCNSMDPYLNAGQDKKNKDYDEDSEDSEDKNINPTDAVIVCAGNEDDISQLEVWVYTESDDGEPELYVHHDILISAFPLCTAWLDCPLKGGDKGNFIAVGLMGEPVIEIWDLDILDEVQPCVVLGGIAEKIKKKGKKTSIKYKEGSHTDSVLGLAWNKEIRNVLASASADNQVKIWDVATGTCTITLEHHTDKVQAVAWNNFSPKCLLSGSFDHSVVLRDGGNPSHSGYKWKVTADVECLAWDPHTEHYFVVSLEDGTVQGFDIRCATSSSSSENQPIFTLHAHDKAATGISYNPAAPNLLATGSTDKMVKLWDLSNSQPSCIASKNLKAGAVFSISFSEEDPFLLAVGGSKGQLEVWDTSYDVAVEKKFGRYIRKSRTLSES